MDLDLDQMAFQDTAQVMGSNPVGPQKCFWAFLVTGLSYFTTAMITFIRSSLI